MDKNKLIEAKKKLLALGLVGMILGATGCTSLDENGVPTRIKIGSSYSNVEDYYKYAIQDGKEMRWTQTSAPSATSITGFTKISGAVNKGLARGNNNAYFGYSSWWAAVGSWTPYGSGATRGIPGMDGTNAIYYLAVYARIETPHAFVEDGLISGQQIYEY